MTDPKNIVIKVKYTTPGTAAETSASNVKMITEWNIKRIACTVSVLILSITALFLLLAGNSEPEVAARNETALPPTPSASQSAIQSGPKLSSPEVSATPEKQAAIPNLSSPPAVSTHAEPSAPAGNGGRIRRAALAYRIVDKEPADLIEGNVSIGNGKPVQMYYFTEVRGKTAQTLFHEWLRNGQRVLRHPVAIAAERWRTSSQRELGLNDRGNWSVRTIDNHGTVMNEIRFTVSAE
ncbi:MULTISPECIES: DUF2914 domain-containing protein [Methylomicrobium]|uniref:DUF2914 domain-containing protein n=1 Tax=Methylomicrobium album BG8 TaxID=686340 RepID=H8GKS8_METAL|nr:MULTISPECIES: DUF2914 domain-containing protein [Methylomicrobium]EIC29250.1 Protein of unknown function (DUF2914) [Methylomicrobium album BG8]